ncbi:hypothetical protein [Hymenobacter lucidus]|uniref:Uncharacterized protein n=1 Tax=Hymenobacter lucidus TaxID=2880930 RepID=A0ABS8ASL3_9BACT|nr:hypothetical protein [Hymenobacter lucidus]MCB2408776.1 hypothetical protein [Hymenobacter lucidus]
MPLVFRPASQAPLRSCYSLVARPDFTADGPAREWAGRGPKTGIFRPPLAYS